MIANSRNSYNANAFEFCILYTFARSDYDGLKKEFTDIGPRLRTGLRHYKNSHMEEVIQTMKNLALFQDFTDKEVFFLILKKNIYQVLLACENMR